MEGGFRNVTKFCQTRVALRRYTSGKQDNKICHPPPPKEKEVPPPPKPPPPQPKTGESKCLPPYDDNIFRHKAVRVAILGADMPTGEPTAFLLKQNPVVSQLYLYGGKKVHGIAADLNHMDTRCHAHGFSGSSDLPHAIRCADIILMLAKDEVATYSGILERINSEGPRVIKLAAACCRYAPRSILAVCVSPISVTVPLVDKVFKMTYWYNPARIIGSVAIHQIRANSLAARLQDLDPATVNVPIVGGPDADCLVPLFTRATPLGLTLYDCEILTSRFKGLAEDASPVKTPTPCKVSESPFSEAFSLNRMVTTIALGLCGDEQAIFTAFVRSNLIKTCQHLVCTVKFGTGGVVHNFGIPKLSPLEFKMFERCTILLRKREGVANEFLSRKDNQKLLPKKVEEEAEGEKLAAAN